MVSDTPAMLLANTHRAIRSEVTRRIDGMHLCPRYRLGVRRLTRL